MNLANRTGFIFITIWLLFAVGILENRYAEAQTASSTQKPQRFITVDFDNVDIRLFIKYISELTGKNFVVDKQVQGTVTIISPTKISEVEAYKVFESVLEVNGFTTVSAGAVTKILPSIRARTQNLDILQSGDNSDPEDKIVTQLVPLRYSAPDAIKNVLAPLVNQTSIIIAYAPSNMLIITETKSNIKKLLKIIEVLDVESTDNEVVVIPLENASSVSLAKILNTVFRQNTSQKSAIQAVSIVPYQRVNSLLVLAEPTKIKKINKIVALLDTKMERDEGNIHVFYLQHSTATELSKVLTSLAGTQSTEDKGKSPAISKDVKIMADEETNSLVITASRDEYYAIEDVIKKLDIPRRMVYLEALIMEVNTDKEFEVGVEWTYGETFNNGSGAVVGSFPNTINSGDDAGLGNFSSTEGFSFGVVTEGISIGGVTFPSLSAVLSAYQDDSDVNIIATPQILTTDNKKAEISVGENVPYITSSQAGEATGTEYVQYEYKDVSTKLAITPHINQSNTLRLEILTEVIKLKTTTNTPTTYKRTAETTVLLNDRGTVVIGGIIAQESQETVFKVPILGDIPWVGWLFRTEYTNDKKTNMFIFITPRIIDNPADIAAITLEKKDKMNDVLPDVLPTVEESLNPIRNKEHATELADIGFTKLQQGKLEQAGNFFDEALAIDSQNPYALVNKGVYYEKIGNKKQAIEMYKQAILYSDGEMADQTTASGTESEPIVEIAKENISRLLADEFLNDSKE